MDNQSYHADTTRISKSGLDQIARSPAHYWQNYLAPDRPKRKQTPALLIGSVFHKLTLEPETFKQEYLVEPDNAPNRPTELQLFAENPSAKTRQAIDFWGRLEATYPEHQVISRDVFDTAQRMRDAVMKHPAARELFAIGGTAERTVLFTEPVSGAPCKCRPDYETKEDIVLDLKSTIDASPAEFGRSAYNYRYHVQAPFYLDGINAEAGFRKVNDFVFIACEKEPPFGVGVYFADKAALELGREAYIADCETYMECLRTGQWPAYSPGILGLQIPSWAYRR
jgi:hypothetical protein